MERAEIAVEPRWFPAVENRGEGVFVHLRQAAVWAWLKRAQVAQRVGHLHDQHNAWQQDRRKQRPFPGGPYILLHTLAHLLIQSMSMRCGYPASSIRERVYVEDGHHGVLLYTGTPDAEGTLGGLVQQARHIEDHLANALEMAPAVLQRPDLRPARRQRRHGAALPARRRLPRLRANRGDLLRDA